MTLAQALTTIATIIKEAMAADNFAKYIIANLADLYEAGKVIFEFGWELLAGQKVMAASDADEMAAGDLMALLAEAQGEDPPLPQLGPMVWLTIAIALAKIIWQARRE